MIAAHMIKDPQSMTSTRYGRIWRCAIETAVERLPGSPGETYLDGRGISLDVARSLRLRLERRRQARGARRLSALWPRWPGDFSDGTGCER